MGKALNHRLAILTVLLATAGFLSSFNVQSVPSIKNIRINDRLSNINGWHHLKTVELDDNIIKALALDDYLNSIYIRQNKLINLYIGYYLTPGKIGAAHDPLVCFPGQGWSLEILDDGTIKVRDIDPARKISYASMIVSKGAKRELIVYWFQVDSNTSSDTLGQKLNLLKSKIARQRGENAFVRISTEIGDESLGSVRTRIFGFIESFYPHFIDYIVASDSLDRVKG